MSEKNLLSLTVSRVDKAVFDGEVISVNVPGVDGEMTLLANHEALISPLKAGKVVVKKSDNSTEEYEIEAGTLEISNNHATILI